MEQIAESSGLTITMIVIMTRDAGCCSICYMYFIVLFPVCLIKINILLINIYAVKCLFMRQLGRQKKN